MAQQTAIEGWMTGVVSLRMGTMTSAQCAELHKALSLYCRKPDVMTMVSFAQESGDWIHVPRGWYLTHGGSIPWLHNVEMREGRSEGHPLPSGIRTTMVLGQAPFPADQPLFVANMDAGARRTGIGGTVLAPTRYGKTGCAIAAALRLGGSTLVAVNTALLMRQWQETWEKWIVDSQGEPVGPAGVIQGKRFDLPPERPFVIGMLQTLVRRGLSEDVRNAFRTVILEEADCAPTSMAMSVLRRTGLIRKSSLPSFLASSKS